MADERPRGSSVEFSRTFERWAAGQPPVPPLGGISGPPSTVDMFHNPRYIVLRGAPGYPIRDEGLWLELAEIPTFGPPGAVAEATCRPTGRYEIRADDGCWAEVYEVGG